MEELQLQVLQSINKHIGKQQSCAYFETICTEVFGELTEENEKKLNEVLDTLLILNRITKNGDRLALVESSILMIDEDLNQSCIKGLENTGLEFKVLETDIGHGANLAAIGLAIQQTIQVSYDTGVRLAEIKAGIEAFKWVYNNIKEFFKNREVYYSDDFIVNSVIAGLYDEYVINRRLDREDIKIILKTKESIPVGSNGYYSRHNYCFRPGTLETSPERILFLAIEVYSDEFLSSGYDYELVTLQLTSTNEVISKNTLQAYISGPLHFYIH